MTRETHSYSRKILEWDKNTTNRQTINLEKNDILIADEQNGFRKKISWRSYNSIYNE